MSDLIIGLVRHAESLWVQEAIQAPVPCFGGRMDDVDLSPLGMNQAMNHGASMRRSGWWPTGLYSSVALRAGLTGQLAWDSEPIPMAGLQELDWGEWKGQPRTIADAPQYREARARLGLDFVPPGPGGESPNMVLERTRDSIKRIVHQHSLGLVLVYAHNSVIKTLVGQALGWPAEQFWRERPAVVSLTTFRVGQGGKLQLLEYNRPTI